MSIFKNALVTSLGLEDDAPNVQVNIEVDEAGMPIDSVTEEGENTPEADEVEIIEEASEIEADNDVIDEMQEAAESLEKIYLAMESAQSNGGLTSEAAMFASIAVDNVVSKYGVSSEAIGISLESFADNRSHATTVSMESVGDALKSLWETIVEKFQEMVKKIVDFYNKTLAAAPRIKRRADALRKKARATTGTAKEKNIKVGLYGALNIQGNVPTATQLADGLKSAAVEIKDNEKKKDIQANAKDVFGSLKEYSGVLNEVAIAGAIAKGLGLGDVTESGGTWSFNGGTATSRKVGNQTAARAVKLIDSLPGNKVLFTGSTSGVTRNNPIDALGDFASGVYSDAASIKSNSDAKDLEWPVLSPSEVENLCEVVIQSMDAIIAQKTQANKKVNSVKILKAEGNRAIAKIKGEGSAESQAVTRRVMSRMVELARTENKAWANLVSYNYRTSKAVLGYCSRSLNQYKNK